MRISQRPGVSFVLLGGLSSELVEGQESTETRRPQRTEPVPHALVDASGRLVVARAVREMASGFHRPRRGGSEPADLVVVTDLDLLVPECSSAFGFADRRRRVAIVSTFRLHTGTLAGLIRPRLWNVIAHERGHLCGLAHCRTAACVMRPVEAAYELDTRPGRPCGQCPRRYKPISALATLWPRPARLAAHDMREIPR